MWDWMEYVRCAMHLAQLIFPRIYFESVHSQFRLVLWYIIPHWSPDFQIFSLSKKFVEIGLSSNTSKNPFGYRVTVDYVVTTTKNLVLVHIIYFFVNFLAVIFEMGFSYWGWSLGHLYFGGIKLTMLCFRRYLCMSSFLASDEFQGVNSDILLSSHSISNDKSVALVVLLVFHTWLKILVIPLDSESILATVSGVLYSSPHYRKIL